MNSREIATVVNSHAEDFNGETGKKELPVPGTFLLDSRGIVRLAHVDVDYTHRLDPDNVVAWIANDG
jgi:peroxiredoxin